MHPTLMFNHGTLFACLLFTFFIQYWTVMRRLVRDGIKMSEGVQMRKLLVASAVLAALCVPALAGNQNGQGGNGQGGNGQGGNGQGGVHGAPGPIAGAGLPILAVGYGAYWLVRRYRRKSDNASS
jgi:hypothetical protein